MSDIQSNDVAGQIEQTATALVQDGTITAQNIARVSSLAQNPEAIAQAIVNLENDVQLVKDLVNEIKSAVSPDVAAKFEHMAGWLERAIGYIRPQE